jgi:large subunit ribosomal protein L23
MGKYRFAVAPYANKITVRKAVEKMFGVTVADVNIQNVKGKVKRRGRHLYKRSDWKKAIVTLHDGQSIDFVERFGDKG